MVNNKLIALYDELEKSNIKVSNLSFIKDFNALSYMCDDNTYFIGLNPDACSSERKEYCILMEEQAHYDAGIIPNDYMSNSRLDILSREKNEVRAKKKVLNKLIPKDKLIKFLKERGHTDVEEIAEEFDVIPEFVQQALLLYSAS